ncbi:type II secretion system F family protein [Salana multivorans]
MRATLGVILGALLAAGLLLLVLALRPQPAPDPGAPAPTGQEPTPVRRSANLRGMWATAQQRTRVRDAVLGAGIGALLATATGIVVLLPLAAALGVSGPPLFRRPPGARALERAQALEVWTRALAGMLAVGVGLEESIRSSLPSTPTPIRPEIARLVGRLQAQQPTQTALGLWAQEMDERTADLIAAALIMGASTRRGGLSHALGDLSASVSAHTRTMQRIEADRAGTRTATRVIAGITAAMFTVIVLGPMGEAYRAPAGQAVLLLLGLGYAAILAWMHHLGRGHPAPRFLTGEVTP